MEQIKLFIAYVALFMMTLTGCGAPSTQNIATSLSMGVASANRQITVSWSKPSTATKSATSTTGTYNIYWSTTPGVTKQNGNKISTVTSPYIHSGLTNDTMYYYVVTEVVSDAEGAESLEVATSPKAVVPLTPTGTTISPLNAATQIKIDRTGAATTTKFNLYWSKSANLDNPAKIANAFGTGTTFQHTALANGTIYYYAVTAEGPEGESPKSKTMAATPLADIPAANYQPGVSPAKIATPNAITAVAANQLVTLTWNMPASQIPTIFDPAATPTQPPIVSAYTIYWSNSFITNAAMVNKIKVPFLPTGKLPMSFTHNTALTNNTPYYYIITAVADTDASGNPLKTVNGAMLTFESPVSSQIMVTPEANAPASPTGFSAVSGIQQITLSWTKSTTANIIYTIYASNIPPARPEDLISTANRIATVSTSPYTHSGLKNGQTYYYVVTATTNGESLPSAVIAVTLK